MIKNKYLKEVLKALGLFLLGAPMLFLYCDECLNDIELAIFGSIYSGAFWVFLWMGNGYITNFLDTRLDWLKQTNQRFFIGLITTVGYSVIFVFLNNLWFYHLYLGRPFSTMISSDSIQVSLKQSLLITTFISLFLHGRSFLKAWRQSAINEEKLKSEIITSRYESLKNQVNPHFLFNSLNVLTSLVYKDQDLAAKFIRKLADVYRYVLDTRENELVSMEEELKFVNDFVFLQKLRFDESLHVQVMVSDSSKMLVPPLSIQILIENAIKHNVVSEENPLYVDVFIEGEFLIVKNNLQIKNTMQDGTGLGLKNIEARYEFLSKEKVQISKTDGFFIVKLPLLYI